jgi:hypothetical protein
MAWLINASPLKGREFRSLAQMWVNLGFKGEWKKTEFNPDTKGEAP